MATINDLIEQISNPQLRERVKEEVSKLTKQKKFGLVYETHEPEMTLMYDAPVRVGSKVVKREDTESKITPDKLLIVKRVRDGVATCESLNADESYEMKVADVVATYTIPCSDLVCIAENGEPIYPYLMPMDSVQNDPDSNLWHTLIEADNYHALQLLAYLYPGQVDCIYIDPPYNKPDSHDWKYNCGYVDSTDEYCHSKWLSMMEERLKLARRLLNPKGSVLIVTIDELEYKHLGCLLEQIFPEAVADSKNLKIQMITSVISAKGIVRAGKFSRVEEYLYIIEIGNSPLCQCEVNMLDSEIKKNSNRTIDWLGFRRRAPQAKRESRPHQFYPIFVDISSGHIHSIGDVVARGIDRNTIPIPTGCVALWPLNKNCEERLWSLVPEQARENNRKGYLKVNWNASKNTGTVYYLAEGTIDDIEKGVATTLGYNTDGSINAFYQVTGTTPPKRVWNMETHNAETYGTNILSKIIGDRFSYPKSLYAAHDTIRFFVANKPNALVVDFFAGSGTTLHAVNLLNKEDGGNRRCIMVTNNEISAEEEETFKAKGLHKGDEEWEKYGIARYVNWPRTKCSILGIDVNGKPLEGDYISANTEDVVQKRTIKQFSLDLPEGKAGEKLQKQILQLVGKKSNTEVLFNVDDIDDFMENIDDATDTIYVVTANNKDFKDAKEALAELPEITKNVPQKIPMADGFKANAAFFKLGFLDKKHVSLGRQLKELMPLLWMKAGAHGVCPKKKDDELMVLPENKMAVLVESYKYNELKRQLTEHPEIETVFIIEDSEDEYRNLANGLKVKNTYQLYRDYLDNFKINIKTK